MSTLHPAVSRRDHRLGDENKAKITLVEYGDYQCAYCGQAYPVVKKIQKKFGDHLLLVFRNFPLQEVHPDAYNAALAAEAAALQGKFWQMHDVLYENQESLDWQSIARYANGTGLDLKKFETDINEGRLQQKIDGDIESGMRSGVNGTPSFYVNSVKYNGDWSYNPFAETLEELLAVMK